MSIVSNRVVNWANIDTSKIQVKGLDRKEYNKVNPVTGKKEKFVNLNKAFLYNYGTDEEEVWGNFNWATPFLYTKGINTEKSRPVLQLVFDHMNNQEHKDYIVKMNEVKARFDELAYEGRFELERPLMTMEKLESEMKGFYHINFDKKTGEQFTEQPYSYLAVLCTQFTPSSFMTADKKPFSWQKYKDYRFEGYAVLNPRHICSYGKDLSYSTQLKAFVANAIVPMAADSGAGVIDFLSECIPSFSTEVKIEVVEGEEGVSGITGKKEEVGEGEGEEEMQESATDAGLEQLMAPPPVKPKTNLPFKNKTPVMSKVVKATKTIS